MLATLIAFAAIAQADAPQPGPLLMRSPTTNGKEVIFQYAGDLWSVPIQGGSANRITNSPGQERGPIFSPNGKQIAFTGEYDGNVDVFVMPAEGGIPKRLTAHPSTDTALGWTPDGKDVLFSSGMYSTYPAPRLCTVPAAGGVPKALPLPSGTQGCFSPDGEKIAYVAGYKWEQAWKRYRGGQAYSIWIARLSDSKWEQIPKKNENNDNPMWVGKSIYYLSDKNGIEGLYRYDTDNGNVKEVIKGDGFDIKSASAGPGVIVYEKLGSLNAYDTQSGETHQIPVTINGDFPEVRTEIKNVTRYINGASISPTGQRVVVTARSRVFTVPASKGDVHLLADGDGIDRKDPAWSPDGRTIAYITDEREKQELALLDITSHKPTYVTLGDPPAVYASPTWSPDSKKIAYTDNRHQVWILDVATGKSTKVDTGTYSDPQISIDPRWSPDSKWITWSRDLDSHMNAVFVYSLDSGKVTQVTDGMANAKGPVFDRDGKYIFFFASTNSGQSVSWLDLTSFNQPNVTSRVYAIVLSKDAPNPLQPESDEEPVKEEKPAAPADQSATPPAKPEQAKPDKATPTPTPTKIDLDQIDHRIIVLPFPSQDYGQLGTTAGGNVLALFSPPKALVTDNPGPGTILKFNFGDRQVAPFADGVGGFQVSADGSKVMLNRGGFAIVPAMGPPPPNGGAVAMSLMAKVNPRAEWARMFHMVWRNEKLLLYDPNTHGIDVNVMDKRYSPFLANLSSRDDLNYLFTDMLGEIAIGHMFIGGGDQPSPNFIPGGLLGADYTFENHRYRIARIYDGERWNPTLYAPLAQPGINAKVGEYILAIDGDDLTDVNDIYETLEAKAGHQVKIKIGPNADGTGSREVIVVPVASESGLRERAWEEDNRRRVLAATNGQIGYVHVPDTAQGGWSEFNRYYFAQTEKKGMIVDERFNSGGLINNFMVDEMGKKMDAVFTPRHGKDWPTPGASVFGPKVMIINQFSGSGGDMFPWLFRERKIGPLIGKRTWGGLVAAFGFALPDGGSVRSPDDAFYNPNGTWDVEGWGVSPDIDVEFDPYLWRQGKDAQLEAAIASIQKQMKTYPYPHPKKPPYRDNTKVDVRY
jgi:tricorn protease